MLMREAIGSSLRRARTARRRTLREVSRAARVSLGYLSEVERGRKEASSELLAAICEALDISVPDLLSDAAAALFQHLDAASRTRRPVGLRHMDLRLAVDDERDLAPSVHGMPLAPAAPVAPVAPAPRPVAPPRTAPVARVRAAA